MTWPAPTTPPAAPGTAACRRGDDRRTARPVAAWLAATGGSLVLVAAIVAVAGNWQDIAAGIKLAGLLTSTTTVDRRRRAGPIIAPCHGPGDGPPRRRLVAPVGIAGVGDGRGNGGRLRARRRRRSPPSACDVQARRWRAPLLDAAHDHRHRARPHRCGRRSFPSRSACSARSPGCALLLARAGHRRGHVRPGRRGDSAARRRSPSNGSEPGRSTGSAPRVRS